MDSKDTKKEIFGIARNLFYTKGYSKTSVQNIIDGANIAKGTFYHYFKSKDELLNQLTNDEVSSLYDHLYKIEQSEISAIEKLNTIFQSASGWKSENIAMMKLLISTVMSDSNLVLRHNILKHTIDKLDPIYESIITQGVAEGSFNVKDPKYISHYILTSFVNNSNLMLEILSSPIYTEEILDDFRSLIANFEDTMERLLGAKSGTVKIIEEDVLEKLLKGLLEASND